MMPLFAFCLLTVNYTPAAPPPTPHSSTTLLQPHLLSLALSAVLCVCVAHTPRVTGISLRLGSFCMQIGWQRGEEGV